MASSETRERILDAAESLFGERGFDGSSLREITRQAGANIAAVNYHFGSKEDLLRAVLARRMLPIAKERFARLESVEARAREAGVPPAVEEVVRAFVEPVFERFRPAAEPEQGVLMRLMGRILAEPSEFVLQAFHEQLSETARRFLSGLQEALPEVPAEELAWRMHFMVGVLVHVMMGREKMRRFSGRMIDVDDIEGTLRRLVVFVSAGLRAPIDAPSAERR